MMLHRLRNAALPLVRSRSNSSGGNTLCCKESNKSRISHAVSSSSASGSDDTLTTNELKALLERAGVDYRDCLERDELVKRMRDNLGRVTKAAASRESSAERGASALDPDERAGVEVFSECSPSVVNISTSRQLRNPLNLSTQELPAGTGSGVVWDSHGHLITNYHVCFLYLYLYRIMVFKASVRYAISCMTTQVMNR